MYKCIPHESKKGVFVVLLNEEPWKEIHSNIFGKNPKLIGEFNEIEYRLARNFSLRKLAKQSLSSYAIKALLDERLVSSDTINRILDELQSQGYVNDQEWIESFVRGQKRKNNGPNMIVAKLKAKGFPKEIIKEHVQIDDPSLQIRQLLQTKYRNRDLSVYKEKCKVVAGLMRRGFNFEDINPLMNDLGD